MSPHANFTQFCLKAKYNLTIETIIINISNIQAIQNEKRLHAVHISSNNGTVSAAEIKYTVL